MQMLRIDRHWRDGDMVRILYSDGVMSVESNSRLIALQAELEPCPCLLVGCNVETRAWHLREHALGAQPTWHTAERMRPCATALLLAP